MGVQVCQLGLRATPDTDAQQPAPTDARVGLRAAILSKEGLVRVNGQVLLGQPYEIIFTPHAGVYDTDTLYVAIICRLTPAHSASVTLSHSASEGSEVRLDRQAARQNAS